MLLTHKRQLATSSLLMVGWLVGWFIVFNAIFNNISVISWQSVLLVEETEYPQVADKLYHIMLYQVPHHERGSNSQL
jgi:hypothetical protein